VFGAIRKERDAGAYSIKLLGKSAKLDDSHRKIPESRRWFQYLHFTNYYLICFPKYFILFSHCRMALVDNQLEISVIPPVIIEFAGLNQEMIYKLTSTLGDFLAALSRNRTVFALEKDGEAYRLVKADFWESQKHVLGDFRPIEPLKSLVFRPREAFGALLDDAGPSPEKERIVIGAKGCDISALKIHDYVFLKNEPVDPYYKELRDKTFLVSCDCAAPCDACFCTAVGEQPYPKEGFDINISPVGTHFLIESGSARGEKLLTDAKGMLQQADASLITERDKNREVVTKKVSDQAAGKGLKKGQNYTNAVKKTLEGKVWNSFAKNCVECGACNFVCCTCHCFILGDGLDEKKVPSRVRKWDSCLLMNFARVAGNANPRKHRAERLYNRFDKKFVYFPGILGKMACDGCGRCAQACTGKIDIREVLAEAINEAESV
jgi:sulfhydrogenase subunit beta (sulfur reductase)